MEVGRLNIVAEDWLPSPAVLIEQNGSLASFLIIDGRNTENR